jgi:hypothetical protein
VPHGGLHRNWTVRVWLALASEKYAPVKASTQIELGPAELAQQIDWP